MSELSSPTRGPQTSRGPWREIAPGIHARTAEPDSVTIGLIIGSEAALLVDTGSTPEQGRALRESVAELTDIPLVGAVVTHWHRDHWFGLKAFEDLQTWGHESLADEASTDRTAAELTRLGLSPADLLVPKTAFAVASAVNLGDRYVEMVHLGQAHTKGDVIVNVADAGVAFLGDLIEQPHPWYDEDSSPLGWPNVLNLVLGMVKSGSTLVGGHGEPMDVATMTQQLGNLANLPAIAEELLRRGVPLERAGAEGDWPLPWPNIEAGVRTAYAEMHAEGIRHQLPISGL